MAGPPQVKLESDVLMCLITLFTMLSTISAVLYVWFGLDASSRLFSNPGDATLATLILLRANLLLPLLATIVRGIFASVSPMLKYVSLKNAAVALESEIYMYRTPPRDGGGGDKKIKGKKVKGDKEGGKGSSRGGEEKGENKGGGGGGGGGGGSASASGDRSKQGTNPRRAFSNALDAIWAELAASDVQNGSLRLPFNPNRALDDVNKRISSNRKEQDSYLTLLAMSQDGKKGKQREEDEVEM